MTNMVGWELEKKKKKYNQVLCGTFDKADCCSYLNLWGLLFW